MPLYLSGTVKPEVDAPSPQIQINLRTLRRLPRIPKDLIQGESHDMETDENDLEVELDCGPYQLVPWIVRRVSQDPSRMAV